MKTFKQKVAPVCIILACVVAIITVCVLLFTGGDDGGHVVIEPPAEEIPVEEVRGELEISLVRERLETATLNSRGLVVTHLYDERKDFSKSKENIFGITSGMMIGPRCYFKADMAISNAKGYSFLYWLEIIPTGGSSLLAEQLELTVETGGETYIKRTLGSGLTTKTLPEVNGSDISRFTVKLEYLDVENNNDTKNSTLAFDLVVHARLK